MLSDMVETAQRKCSIKSKTPLYTDMSMRVCEEYFKNVHLQSPTTNKFLPLQNLPCLFCSLLVFSLNSLMFKVIFSLYEVLYASAICNSNLLVCNLAEDPYELLGKEWNC